MSTDQLIAEFKALSLTERQLVAHAILSDEAAQIPAGQSLVKETTFSERWSGKFTFPTPDPEDARLSYLLQRFSDQAKVKILVDTDVLLDVPLAGPQRHFPDSIALINWCESHRGTAHVAWHSISNIYYILSRQKPLGLDSRIFLRDLLSFVTVVPTGTAQAHVALGLPMPDFEDALQVSAALLAGVNYIVTRNKNHYQMSPIPSLTPTEFLNTVPN